MIGPCDLGKAEALRGAEFTKRSNGDWGYSRGDTCRVCVVE